jgi:hypothetical protein
MAGHDHTIEHAALAVAAKAVPAIPYFIQQTRGMTVLMSVNRATNQNISADPSNRSPWRSECVDASYREGFKNRRFRSVEGIDARTWKAVTATITRRSQRRVSFHRTISPMVAFCSLSSPTMNSSTACSGISRRFPSLRLLSRPCPSSVFVVDLPTPSRFAASSRDKSFIRLSFHAHCAHLDRTRPHGGIIAL